MHYISNRAMLSQIVSAPLYQTIVPAKCILAGAHAVLRGHAALVVPLAAPSVTLQYWQTPAPFTYSMHGPDIIPERLPLGDFFDYVCCHLPNPPPSLTGHFHLQFDIGIANGLGTSASMAVAFTRWCAWQQLIDRHDLFQYAHCFEHFFHGTSSGIDVAAVLYQQPLIYKIGLPAKPFTADWLPYIYLSSCGKTSDTKTAIARVATVNDSSSDKGRALDLQMAHCVELMQQGLMATPHLGFDLLNQAFNVGYNCYQAWELNNDFQVQQHCHKLKQYGAKAVKPTGAGDGGYILSLWEQPPIDPPFKMIQVFS